jgi:hypothetical protein
MPRKTPIRFQNRVLRASKEEANLQGYLWWLWKKGGDSSIRLEDKEAEAEQEAMIYALKDENAEIIRGLSLAQLQAAIHALGGVVSPSEKEQALRLRLRKENDKDPQRLNERIRSSDTEVAFYVQKVWEKTFLKVDGDKIFWDGPGLSRKFMMNLPKGKQVVDFVTETLTDDAALRNEWLDVFVNAINRG